MIEKGRRARWWRRTGKSARSFKYVDEKGKKIGKPAYLDRIKSLVIPPAWQFVRINPSTSGKIQAVGMDAMGRVQYLYHPTFSAKQQRAKFAKIESFGKLLPQLRRATNEDIDRDGLPREKVLAVVMRLIDLLYFRVGTDLSAEHYKTYGITTLQKRHLKIGNKSRLSFEFIGKSHIEHRKVIVDRDLAAILKELTALGKGRKLFRYVDANGKAHPITPAQINAYIKAATSSEYSSKDLRTWGATVLAAVELAEIGVAETDAERKRSIVKAVKHVAEELGNTPAVCRNSYIHPAVLDAYESGLTIKKFRRNSRYRGSIKRKARELEPEERALIKLFNSKGRK